MSEHIYEKNDIARRLDDCLNKTLEEIDTRGFFEHIKHGQQSSLQKGAIGTLIEQCVFDYDPDTRQEADLIIIDGDKKTRTELKTTGMVKRKGDFSHYEAKETMSITAVGIYDISDEVFETSHFWDKLEHMLIVYYFYDADHPVPAYEYRLFKIKGYEFHEFSNDEAQTLKQDWDYVHDLCETIVSHHPGVHDKKWKAAVKAEYIKSHDQLKRLLSYIDLSPMYPPRFRLKQSTVTSIISKHFGYSLEQVPGRYITISDIDNKCHELTAKYSGKTIRDISKTLGISYNDKSTNKSIAEKIIVAMFGGTAKMLNKVEIFNRFGLTAKTITLTAKGEKTEDMKLFKIDFSELTQKSIVDEDGNTREYQFEDSDFYSYFADNEFLCIIFKEPPHCKVDPSSGESERESNNLIDNTFVGFKRLVFDDDFIYNYVKPLWDDSRNKIMNDTLVDVVKKRSDGSPITNKNGEISSAPNFMKSKQNAVFIRGDARDSSSKSKNICINGIKMIPQYVWIKGTVIIDELEKIDLT